MACLAGRVGLAAGAVAVWTGVALAQVPPHVPGTICFTPEFWCWVTEPGLPGETCLCLGPDGRAIEGILG